MTEQSRTREGLLLGGLGRAGLQPHAARDPRGRAGARQHGGGARARAGGGGAGGRSCWPCAASGSPSGVTGPGSRSSRPVWWWASRCSPRWRMRDMPAAHGAVLVGLLPAATAVAAVFRARERPSRASGWWRGGARLPCWASRRRRARGGPPGGMGWCCWPWRPPRWATPRAGPSRASWASWRVMCWALVLSAPLLLPVVALSVGPDARSHASPRAWAGLAYVSGGEHVPRLLRLVPGAGAGGVARVSQLQLAQPLLTLGWCALLLGEPGGARHAGRGAARGGCVFGERAQPRPAAARARGPAQGTVRISAPCSVTSRVCSNWALRLPSAVTAVHPSSHARCVPGRALIIGSTVKVIPGSMTVCGLGLVVVGNLEGGVERARRCRGRSRRAPRPCRAAWRAPRWRGRCR